MICIQINMELTGFKENIKSLLLTIEQEADKRKELSSLAAERKKLSAHIIDILEEDKLTGLVYRNHTFTINEKKRKNKISKILVIKTNK